jgi:hypothetical protein
MRSATKITVSTFGILAGLAGMEHGIGEIRQGSVAPGALVIQSWPGSAFFQIVNGEPAMTVIPNLLVTGILAVILSLLFIVWVTGCVHRKDGARVMVLLSIAMLLAGGGFGPPLLGLILSAHAAKIHAPQTGWQALFPAGVRRYLAKAWRPAYIAALVAWLSMFPGSSILDYFFGVDDANLMLALILAAFGLLLVALQAAFAFDSQARSSRPLQAKDGHPVPQIAMEG